VASNATADGTALPEAVWAGLKAEGLLRAEAPAARPRG
jgi:hypothetical protein